MSGIRLNDPDPRFSREVSRLFDDLFGAPRRPAGDERGPAAWSPRADVAETDAAYLITVDLPGLAREAVTLMLEDGELRISGERPAASPAGGEEITQFHRAERRCGTFFRSFRFPSALDADAVTARFADGVLHVALPKAAERQPRRIEIE